jgi:hypothetical protein
MKTIPSLLAMLVAAGFAVSGVSAQENSQPYQHQKKRPAGEAGWLSPDRERKRPHIHSPEKREMMRNRMLEKFDTDKDGTLSDAEKAAARAAHEERMKEHRARFLERFDTDKDGTLSDAEKAAARAAHEERKKERQERRAKFLERFDTDKDGQLSEAEKAAARTEMEKHRKADKPGYGGP